MRCIWTWVGVLAVLTGLLGVSSASAEKIYANVAAAKPVTSSTPYSASYPASFGNDERHTNFTHGQNNNDCWWRVDLQQAYDVAYLEIRSRATLANRTNGATLRAYAPDGATQIGSDLVLSGFGNTSPLMVSFDNGGAGWGGAQFFQVGGEDIGVNYLHIAEFKAFAAIETYPTFIAAVTATSNNVWSDSTSLDVLAQHLVNNQGMLDQGGPLLGSPSALHREVSAALWHTKINPDPNVEAPYVTFDLGGTYDLRRMLVWNHNQPSLLARGLKEVRVETSTDGTVFTALADTNGDELGNVTFPISPGGSAPYQANVSLAGITAGYVRITGLSNYGDAYWGLSEVRFYAIPEPSILVIAVTGIVAAVICGWRKRR